MFSCQAILFDLDGTLIDSIAAVDRAWSRWAKRHGLDPAVVVPQIHGRRAVDSLRLLSPDPLLDLDAESEWLEGIESEDTDGVVEIPGAIEFIASIPRDRWSVVTSGTSPVAIARMNAVGLNPRFAVFGEDVLNGKPAPDPYLLAAERMQVDPKDCVVFEDTAAGIRSGKSAGMRVIAISLGASRPDLDIADAVVKDYRSLEIEKNPDGLRVQIGSAK